jgi:hypothetical protein
MQRVAAYSGLSYAAIKFRRQDHFWFLCGCGPCDTQAIYIVQPKQLGKAVAPALQSCSATETQKRAEDAVSHFDAETGHYRVCLGVS